MHQDGRGQRRPLPVHPQARLDILLPGIEIVLHLAGENLAKLRIHARHIGREREHRPHQDENA